MVGSAIWRHLEKKGYTNLIGRSSHELDLRNQGAVIRFFELEKPEIVIDAAAKVGGIWANQEHPYTFLMENLQIQNNLIEASHRFECKKFIFLGSSCIYPKMAPQPIKEEYLLTGALEPSNEGYAIAKIAGVKACEAIRKQFGKDFISLMPSNLYGSYDNFDLESSHVLPAMIRKFHDAKESHRPVQLWGTGSPLREFLHVEDLADAVYFTMNSDMEGHLYNVGSATEISIKNLAELIQWIVGHQGEILWDSSKPDGTPRKLMDSSRFFELGWKPKIDLETGITNTYKWFLSNRDQLKEVKFK
ncbi:GDP-L-fucose synthase [Aquiflexum sp. AIY15W]|nr:GDP-L-fucose synthase [Cognataquiflexum rubidum]